ncbi:MAG: hypothetical protein CFE43_17185 [Burkholderiales bacterium PBB3]|nr:MAG: hypothetical protein CFE43_17185 [Burkholderiales bacterium PBB3]
MLNKLTAAIRGRQYISFTYSGLQREAQPATIGVSRAGNDVLRCYQTAGGHVTPGHEWDLCEISKIQDLKVLEKNFQNDPPGYNKGDKGMKHIYEEL